MIIVTFSDKNYEPYVENLYNSFKLSGGFEKGHIFVFYTVGFYSDWNESNLIKIPFPIPGKSPRMNFYKPRILLDIMERFPGCESYCFIDSDAIVGRRLDFDLLLKDRSFDFPLSSHHTFEIPFTWNSLEDGTVRHNTTNSLCEYFNVPVRVDINTLDTSLQSMRYVQNCFILFSERHKDFLLEWMSICENEFLWSRHVEYFPYQDETAFNMLLWKYGVKESLGFMLINTHKFETIKMLEHDDGIMNTMFDPELPWGYCFDSSQIMLYHGTKVQEENIKIKQYIHENSSSNSWPNTNPS